MSQDKGKLPGDGLGLDDLGDLGSLPGFGERDVNEGVPELSGSAALATADEELKARREAAYRSRELVAEICGRVHGMAIYYLAPDGVYRIEKLEYDVDQDPYVTARNVIEAAGDRIQNIAYIQIEEITTNRFQPRVTRIGDEDNLKKIQAQRTVIGLGNSDTYELLKDAIGQLIQQSQSNVDKNLPAGRTLGMVFDGESHPDDPSRAEKEATATQLGLSEMETELLSEETQRELADSLGVEFITPTYKDEVASVLADSGQPVVEATVPELEPLPEGPLDTWRIATEMAGLPKVQASTLDEDGKE